MRLFNVAGLVGVLIVLPAACASGGTSSSSTTGAAPSSSSGTANSGGGASSSSSTSSSGGSGPGSGSSSGGVFVAGNRGLTWPNGIEPGDPSECEAPTSKRCWWIDASAPAGGDGTYANPFKSFEQAIGYWDAELEGYVPGMLSGGDVVYLRGTFDATQNDEQSNKTTLAIARAPQGGTPSEPTVIKSWRGSPRAVFDGGMIHTDLITVSAAPAVRIENIEVRNHGGRGMDLGDRVAWLDVHSIYVHDGIGDGESGVGGGLLLRIADNQAHDFTVRNSVFVNNAINPVGVDGNIGGLSILAEPTIEASTTVRVRDSVFDREVTAIRHKHTGPFTMEASNNAVSNCGTAFGQRGAANVYHHNIVVNCGAAVGFDSWNFHIEASLGEFHHNTFYKVPTLLSLSMEYPDSPGMRVARTFRFHDNILLNAEPQTAGIVSFNDINGELTSLTTIDFDNNLFSWTPHSAPFTRIPTQSPSSLSFEEAMAAYTDTTSFFGDPRFTDAENGDFSLQPGSPGIGAAMDGMNLGAVQD